MAFLGRRDLQSVGALEGDDVQPSVTRTEYLRLLTTARALDKERLYLLVKLFGCTGIPLQELPRVTVEALTEGRVIVHKQRSCPAAPTFRTFCGRSYWPTPGGRGPHQAPSSTPKAESRWAAPPSRTASSSCAGTPGVPEEKANPRCLKRLWQSTQDGIRTQIDLLVEQASDRLMEAEQLTVGWDVGKGVSDV